MWREVRRLWDGKLAPIPPGLIGPTVSDCPRSFLVDVGLPTDGPLGVTFYDNERLLSSLSIGGADYLLLGYDYGTILSVKAGTDEIWSVNPSGEYHPRFVNSRLSYFIAFLGIYDSRSDDRERASDEQHDVIVQEIRRQFISRDACALDDMESWWSLVLEQMSQGLL